MQKMTLLEMVQNILSALDSDEVNSVSDTVESLQVAEVIKETFYEQFNNIAVPEFQGLVKLDSVSDLTRPNYLRTPTNVNKFIWVKYKDYRADGAYRDLVYVPPEDFLHTQLQYVVASNDVVATVDPSGVSYFVRADGPPGYFTMFDDNYLAFDSFDQTYEATLQATNSLAYGWKNHEFKLENTYIPPLDGSLFPLLLAEAKSTCFINLKQISSSKEEQKARRQRIRMQNDQFKARRAQYNYWNAGPNFARRR